VQVKPYLIAVTLLTGATTIGIARADEACNGAVQTAMAEWRQLSSGHPLAPSQVISTRDGRRLRGSEIDWAHVLISRADSACAAGQAAAAMNGLREVQGIFHQPPQKM
jgi:hypothetical protein